MSCTKIKHFNNEPLRNYSNFQEGIRIKTLYYKLLKINDLLGFEF